MGVHAGICENLICVEFVSVKKQVKATFQEFENHLGNPRKFWSTLIQTSILINMDVLANMLITMKNGNAANKESVLIPFSNYKTAVAKVLLDLGYISKYEKKSRKKGQDVLEVKLKYRKNGKPAITNVKRVSKSSCRLYTNAKNIYQVRDGRGHLVLSTPKGIMAGEAAKKERVGGEMLFEIW